jgi:hypothetical protein
MGEVVTKFIRYLYLDVVDFTLKRSVEAQTDIVDTLNTIVRKAQNSLPLAPERVSYLPTGDGLGIAILDEQASYDIHMLFALEVLRFLQEANQSSEDTMRRFEIRVGLSQNTDNIITDINGSKNVAGHGINTAQRVMSFADGSQILVSRTVVDTLSYRERYMKRFRQYRSTTKHGVGIMVYQFTDDSCVGLSVSEPSQFRRPQSEENRLTLHQAYYIAHALANQTFILNNLSGGQNQYALTVLLHFLAEDSVEAKTTSKYDEPNIHIYGEGKATIDEVLKYYLSLDFWVCCRLADYGEQQIRDCGNLFEREYLVVKDIGKDKLGLDYPEILGELSIENA